MKITDYLAHQAQKLQRSSQWIKDFRVFDFNYIPEEPLMREEARPIIDACLRYLTTGIPNHLFIFGSRGSGKTLMVRYIGRLLSQQHSATVLYANCRQQNTSFKILAHLLHVRPRGCGLDELWQRFCSNFRGRVILLLDEVDLISDKDRRKEILYLISRSPNNVMAVLLSNHPRFLSMLDESIRSTLQPETIHFRNYDAAQVGDIVRLRTQCGLTPEAVGRLDLDCLLAELAALTVHATNSDIRVALKTLYYTALEPSANLQSLFHRARRDLVADILADLHERNLMILQAAVDTPEPLMRAVYQRYRKLSQQIQVEPYSYAYFCTNLSYLQSIGLIALVSTKVGRTYANRIELLFDPEMLQSIYRAQVTNT